MTVFARILLCLGLFCTSAGAQQARESSGEAHRLFEEAQRFHLGVDRPVDIRKAVQLYEAALVRDPDHADAHYNLAGICFEHKRYDLAQKHYTQAAKLRPGDGHTYNNLGSVHEIEGRKERARGLYKKAIQVDPTVGAAHYNLARLLLKEGDGEGALAQLEMALRLEPDNPAFVNQAARLEGELGKIPNLIVLLIVSGFAGVVILYWFAFRRPRRRR